MGPSCDHAPPYLTPRDVFPADDPRMNADAFRHLFAYHHAENQLLWRVCAALPDETFAHATGYSHGSIRDQLVHLMDVEEAWFSDLRGVVPPDTDDAAGAPGDPTDRARLRARWDAIEAATRAWLAELRDDRLMDRPLQGEDAELRVWQVLVHVVNHGTDHRAQVNRALHDLGVGIGRPQDYVFYAYEHPAP